MRPSASARTCSSRRCEQYPGVLAASLAGGLLVLATRETQPEPEATDAPLARETERERV